MGKKLLERLTKTYCNKTNQAELSIEKVTKRKINCISNGKAMMIFFNSWIDKKNISIKNMN